MIFFGEESLRRALREYEAHFNRERPHQGIGSRVVERPAEPRSTSLRPRGPQMGRIATTDEGRTPVAIESRRGTGLGKADGVLSRDTSLEANAHCSRVVAGWHWVHIPMPALKIPGLTGLSSHDS